MQLFFGSEEVNIKGIMLFWLKIWMSEQKEHVWEDSWNQGRTFLDFGVSQNLKLCDCRKSKLILNKTGLPYLQNFKNCNKNNHKTEVRNHCLIIMVIFVIIENNNYNWKILDLKILTWNFCINMF